MERGMERKKLTPRKTVSRTSPPHSLLLRPLDETQKIKAEGQLKVACHGYLISQLSLCVAALESLPVFSF
jgi:hypothetical protein